MAATWEIIRNGVATNISSPALLWTLQATGIGAPPKRNISVRGPQQHGHSIVDFRYDARSLALVFGYEATSLADADARRDTIYGLLRGITGMPVSLRVTRDDGAVRQIDGEITGIVDPAMNDTRLLTLQRLAVTLECGDPFWYDPTISSTTFDASDNLSWEEALGTISASAVEDAQEAPSAGQSIAGTDIANGQPWSIAFRTNIPSLTVAQYAFFIIANGGAQVYGETTAIGENRIRNDSFIINSVFATGTHDYFVICDGSTLSVYRDTTLIGSIAHTTGVDIGNSSTVWAGFNNTGAIPWQSDLDYAALYNIALDSTQRAALISALDGSYNVSQTIENEGNYPAFPVITIIGPIEDAVLTNTTTGETLDFTGVTIATGDTRVINCRYGYKTVKDLAGTNKIGDLTSSSDLATFRLEPGNNAFTLEGTGTNANTQVTINFYPRYLGI